jgi:Tfp pilus assembly protein PilV
MKKNLRGISLIEALVTLLVLSIGLLGLGQLQARLWSSSGVLHATSNAYLLGMKYLEILSARQMIAPDLVAVPPSQTLHSGTRFNTAVSLSEDEPLSEAEIRVVWKDRSGSQSVRLESVTGTVSRAFDTRWLLPTD